MENVYFLKKKKQTPVIFSTLTGQVCEAMWGHARDLDLDTLAVDSGENFNHLVTDSDDTDIEDNLESDVLPNLETHSPWRGINLPPITKIPHPPSYW